MQREATGGEPTKSKKMALDDSVDDVEKEREVDPILPKRPASLGAIAREAQKLIRSPTASLPVILSAL